MAAPLENRSLQFSKNEMRESLAEWLSEECFVFCNEITAFLTLFVCYEKIVCGTKLPSPVVCGSKLPFAYRGRMLKEPPAV
jgi:hypothetical protein